MTTTTTVDLTVRQSGVTATERRIIFASSLGTIFECYDFYIYGILGAFLAKHFFSNVPPNIGLIFALLTFAIGFAVRPLGGIIFGQLGDRIGRKYTFLITIAMMGTGTFLIGLLPSFATLGIAAPILLLLLRVMQGFAMAGEYGGAAIYVAESAPRDKRGFYTSWIQATVMLGFLLSLLIILGVRSQLGEEAFAAWGWRVPFLLSAVLVVISLWIRLNLEETLIFQKMKSEGKLSKQPVREAFGSWVNIRTGLCVLFGATAGQGVVGFGGHYFALLFLTQTVKVPVFDAQIMIAVALVLSAPFYIVFGRLSDTVGRKPIVLTGFILVAFTYFPLFNAITHFANPRLEAALASAPVKVIADPRECSFQFKATGTEKFATSCDIAKSALVDLSVNYTSEDAPANTKARVMIGEQILSPESPQFSKDLAGAVVAHGYPSSANPAEINHVATTALLWLLVIYVTLVYGPLAAWLVEIYPSRIRYTGLSLPYHIGAGWFGGFMPVTCFAIAAATGNIYAGLWYPVIIVSVCAVVGFAFLPETKDVDIGRE
jgi:hypothetical protein